MARVGVLALQGSFQEHIEMLKRCGANAMEVRTTEDLEGCDGLIIPGGESTTMAHIANKTGMLEALRNFVIVQKKPVWGTCAGLIFLAETAEGAQQHTGDSYITVRAPLSSFLLEG
jgi:pyridoxal 5'-phosphate synthase pdxT subunit